MRYSDIENAATAQGWRVERTKRGHRRLIPTDETRPVVIGAGTGSDHRGPARFLADARRSGLVWPWPAGKRRGRPGSARESGG